MFIAVARIAVLALRVFASAFRTLARRTGGIRLLITRHGIEAFLDLVA